MPRFLFTLLVLATLLLALPRSARAQVTRADTAAVLLSTARDFQAEGRWEVAEALFQLISERYGDTPAGARAMAALRAPDRTRGAPGSQVELQVWSTLYGAWLGIAIPGALGADNPAPYGVGLLLGGPAGFLGGRRLAGSRALSEGQVRALTFGSLWGSWQGLGWAEVADWGEKTVCDNDVCQVEDPNGEHILRAMVLGGLGGVGMGALLARRPIPSGVATTVNFGALWGTWFGVAGGVLANLEGDDYLAATLLAGNAGLVATALLAPGWNPTRERARLISLAGVIGGLGGAGLDLIFQPDNGKVAMAIPLVGSLAGLGLGAVWTADRAPGRPSTGGTGDGAGPGEDRGLPGATPAVASFRDGRLRIGLPAPFPTLLPVDGPRGPATRTALGVSLFHARF